MALLALVDQIKVKRQAFSLVRGLGLGSHISQAISAFFQEMSQKKGNIQLQIAVFDQQTASAADSVLMDQASTVYAVVVRKKNANAAWLKMSDNATTASSTAAEWMMKLSTALSDKALWFAVQGEALANGFTLRADTTASGNTRSTTGDGPIGFVIFGS